MKQKRILFFTNQAPHYRILLFNELSKRLNIKFIFTHENKKIKGLKANYNSVKGIGYKKYKIHLNLIKIIKKEKPSKIILIAPDPLYLIDNLLLYRYCKKHNLPYSIVVGRWKYKKKDLKQKITEPFYSNILKDANFCIAYGTRSEKWLLKKGIKKEKIIKAYNINPSIYENFNKEIKKISKLKNKKTILYVGRLIKRKGVDYLIRAFKIISEKIDNAVLIIIGGGDFYKLGAKSEESYLKKLVKNLGLKNKVIFTGQLSPERIKKYYISCDVCVFPSITTNMGEPWGHVVEEAMSFGKPVIVTNAVGAGEDLIQKNKNGFIVPEKNPTELKKAIEKILNNKKLKQKMGKESLKIIKQKKFSFQEIVKKWEKGLK